MASKDNFNEIMEAARQMQKNMEEVQKQLNAREETGKAADGLVQVVLNGHHLPVRVHIDDSLRQENMRHLESLVLTAIRDAVRKVDKASQETLVNLTKDIAIPGAQALLEEEGHIEC